MLQTRSAKRTAAAAMRIAIDMVKENLITQEEAVGRVARFLANPPRLSVGRLENTTALTIALAASPGVAWGEIVTSPDDAEKEAGAGKLVILTRPNVPGRLPRDGRGSGDPDLDGRDDIARRGRCP